MLKIGSKRRRTRQEIEEDKQNELEKENEFRSNQARITELEAQLAQMEQQAEHNRSAAVLVNDLMKGGVVKQKGGSSFVADGVDGPVHFDYGNPDEDIQDAN